MSPWTTTQLREVREGVARGETHATIAARIGRTPMAVASQASRHGLKSDRVARDELRKEPA